MLVRYGTDKNGKPVKKAVIYTKEEHLITRDKIDFDAIVIINRLKDAGFHSYIVGGAVRDLITGNTPKDFDIVTDATPSRIKRLFRNSRIIGRRFRIVHVIFGSKIFEVSTFRSNAEGSVGNVFGSMDEDVMRRDFTLNALYYDPIQEQVIDYVGGMRDIKKHVLRPVIPLDRIFVEDPVRMLRAIKYSAKTESKMSFSLRHKIRHSASLLSQISPSRLTEELLKIINSGSAYRIIEEALDTDLFMALQPAASAMMYADKNFESAYMKSILQLDEFVKTESDARLGKKLVFLIKDFIYTLTDWQKELQNHSAQGELYTRTWTECRSFVLPMNPQRSELEYAIKSVLSEMGLRFRTKKSSKKQGSSFGAPGTSSGTGGAGTGLPQGSGSGSRDSRSGNDSRNSGDFGSAQKAGSGKSSSKKRRRKSSGKKSHGASQSAGSTSTATGTTASVNTVSASSASISAAATPVSASVAVSPSV